MYGGSGSGPALKYKSANVTAGEFGSWTPIGAVHTASGYDVAWKDTGTGRYTVWTTDGNGNYKANIGAVSGTSSALEKLEPLFRQDLNRDGVIGLYSAPGTTRQITNALAKITGSATIGTGATLRLTAADSASVTFAGTTGTLKLDRPSTFSGEIFNFSGDGTLSGSDHIDLKRIDYNTLQDSYANGVLTVTDGSGDTAKLNFNGSYVLANFAFASDGKGGTIVYDPPISSSSSQNSTGLGSGTTSAKTGNGAALELPAGVSESVAFASSKGALLVDSRASTSQPLNFAQSVAGQDLIDLPHIAFDAQTTLGHLPNDISTGGMPSLHDRPYGANAALLGNYMASSFAIASDNHGGGIVAAMPSEQPLLSSPHHA
jgi:Tryptophan-rich Synechocystis species C-terminal domain